MSERDEQQFDAMLGGLLKRSLDPQRGRCERRFRGYLSDLRRSAWKQRTWLIGAFASGMAATVAVLWATPLFRANPAPDRSNINSPIAQVDQSTSSPMIPAVERVVQSHTTDEGVILFGNDTPVRVLHRQQLQRTRWLDARQQVQAEQTTPQDDLVFIREPTY